MQRRYITVDVFTDRAFGGNPLAVVLDAGGLSTAQMQAIATEFNYSETTFVLPPAGSARTTRRCASSRVNSELPFAGHPNVGTAFVLATQAAKPPARLCSRRGRPGAGRDPDRAGQGGRRRTHRAAAAEADDRSVGVEQAAACLSLSADDVKTDRHRAADHLGRAVVPGGRSRLARGAAAGQARMRRRSPKRFPRDGSDAVYFYTRDVPAGEKPLRAAGADVPSRRQRTVRRPRDRQRDGGCRGAARRSRRRQATAN